MELELGGRHFDLTSRAVVLGVVDGAEDVERARRAGADAVEVVGSSVSAVPGVEWAPTPAAVSRLAARSAVVGFDSDDPVRCAAAMVLGARVVRTRRVAAVRRLRDVVAAIEAAA